MLIPIQSKHHCLTQQPMVVPILFQGIIDITAEFNVTVDIINTIYDWLFGFDRDISNVGNLPLDVILINPNMDKNVDE